MAGQGEQPAVQGIEAQAQPETAKPDGAKASEAKAVVREHGVGMDALNPTQFVLLLHSVPHIGEKSLARLLRLNAQGRITPETCLRLTTAEWKRLYELHPRAAAALGGYQEALIAESAELARTLRAHSIALLTLESPSYPTRLDRNDDAPPPVLYALGNRALLAPPRFSASIVAPLPTPPKPKPASRNAALYNVSPVSDSASGMLPDSSSDTQPAFSAPPPVANVTTPPINTFLFTIAVSNGATPATLTRQEEIAAALVQQGGIPVTGHDRSPYQRLALVAQRQNRPVCYVLDRGLREALGPDFDRPPFAAARIRDAIFDPVRDLVLSPFRLDDHGTGANNKRRDRLIFALADIIVALDVRAGGGMAGECLRALSQNRPVWVADGGRDGNDEMKAAGCPVLPATPDWPSLLATLR